MNNSRVPLRILLSLVLLMTLPACRTIDYRQVQQDFNHSVQAEHSGDPFTDRYGQVLEQLNPETIDRLQPKLRPNAWMLRSVSAWRMGSNSVALQSVRRGLREPSLIAGSRDHVLLEVMPALLIDSDLRRQWKQAGQKLTSEVYQKQFEPGFQTAWRLLTDSADAAMGSNTPEDVTIYLHFQRWRILLNWTAALGGLQPEDVARAARVRASQFLGGSESSSSPLEMADREWAQIPLGHPFRAWIRAPHEGW